MPAVRFILTPVGSAGDVHPFVGIGRALAARGHEVVVVTSAPFEGVVSRAGLAFRPTVSAEEFEAVAAMPDLWHPRRGLRRVLSEVSSRLEMGYRILESLYEPGRTVLVGHALSFSTRLFEETHAAPAATIHLAPSIFRSDHDQPAFAPGRDLSGWPRWLKRGLWWTVDRLVLDRIVARPLNDWRQANGLAPVHRVFRDWVHSPRLVVGLFPDWFAPVQPDWPPALTLTGFPLYDEADRQAVPADLARFLDAGPPPVVFTPGTANRFASRFFGAGVDACTRLGLRALVLTRYPAQLPSLPADTHHEPFVPLSAILPRSAALVHHGGIGTLAQGLAAGVPQLVMPMGFDQPDNATRLVRLGVGRWLTPSRFTAARVGATLEDLLGSRAVAEACRRCAAALEPRDAVERTCDLLEGLGG